MGWAIMFGKWAVMLAAGSLAGGAFNKFVINKYLPPAPPTT